MHPKTIGVDLKAMASGLSMLGLFLERRQVPSLAPNDRC